MNSKEFKKIFLFSFCFLGIFILLITFSFYRRIGSDSKTLVSRNSLNSNLLDFDWSSSFWKNFLNVEKIFASDAPSFNCTNPNGYCGNTVNNCPGGCQRCVCDDSGERWETSDCCSSSTCCNRDETCCGDKSSSGSTCCASGRACAQTGEDSWQCCGEGEKSVGNKKTLGEVAKGIDNINSSNFFASLVNLISFGGGSSGGGGAGGGWDENGDGDDEGKCESDYNKCCPEELSGACNGSCGEKCCSDTDSGYCCGEDETCCEGDCCWEEEKCCSDGPEGDEKYCCGEDQICCHGLCCDEGGDCIKVGEYEDGEGIWECCPSGKVGVKNTIITGTGKCEKSDYEVCCLEGIDKVCEENCGKVCVEDKSPVEDECKLTGKAKCCDEPEDGGETSSCSTSCGLKCCLGNKDKGIEARCCSIDKECCEGACCNEDTEECCEGKCCPKDEDCCKPEKCSGDFSSYYNNQTIGWCCTSGEKCCGGQCCNPESGKPYCCKLGSSGGLTYTKNPFQFITEKPKDNSYLVYNSEDIKFDNQSQTDNNNQSLFLASILKPMFGNQLSFLASLFNPEKVYAGICETLNCDFLCKDALGIDNYDYGYGTSIESPCIPEGATEVPAPPQGVCKCCCYPIKTEYCFGCVRLGLEGPPEDCSPHICVQTGPGTTQCGNCAPKGQCGSGCQNDNDCSEGEECNLETCECEGEGGGECIANCVECVVDSHCPPNGQEEYCEGRFAVVEPEQVCIDGGKCQGHCSTNPSDRTDCGENEDGEWSYSCEDNSACKTRTRIERGCTNGACYEGQYEEKECEPCGENEYGEWFSYCKDNDVWQKRTRIERGCTNGACYEEQYEDDELKTDCGEDESGEWSNYCVGNKAWEKRTHIKRGCENEACYENFYEEKNLLGCSKACGAGCGSSSDCGENETCNLTTCICSDSGFHNICIGETCVSVSCEGSDECQDICQEDIDCINPPPPPPTYNICIGETCISVEGEGSDACQTNEDCVRHNVCEDETCVSVAGEGSDACQTNEDCVRHNVCEDETCVSVAGLGDDECETNEDCIGFVCGDGACEEDETVWNCCQDCGVPDPGCDDDCTKYWHTCDDNIPTKHTEVCNPFTCENGECAEVCSVACGAECENDENCSEGEICNLGNCNCEEPPLPPYVEDMRVEEAYCLCKGLAMVAFQWEYQDGNGDPESQFQIQIDNDSDFSSPEVDRTVEVSVPSGSVNTQSVIVKPGVSEPGEGFLTYDTTYYWRVEVWDSTGLPSDWYYGTPFFKDPHPYPSPEFECQLSGGEEQICEEMLPKAMIGEKIKLIDKSICYSSCDEYGCVEYDCKDDNVRENEYIWDFGDNTQSNTKGDTTHAYAKAGPYTVNLIIEDDVGPCQKGHTIFVGFKLPGWKEVSPF